MSNELTIHGESVVSHVCTLSMMCTIIIKASSQICISQDHKMICKQFLITGIIWAIIGGLMSVVFRLQLGYPDSTFPWLEDILGKWAKGGKLTPEAYYALVTMHGTILVFFVLTGGLSGTFANFSDPASKSARGIWRLRFSICFLTGFSGWPAW